MQGSAKRSFKTKGNEAAFRAVFYKVALSKGMSVTWVGSSEGKITFMVRRLWFKEKPATLPFSILSRAMRRS